MSWQTFLRVLKLGIVNFWRNKWLSLAATLMMTFTLLIISIFAVSTIAIGNTADSIRDKMDISVYFNDSATADQIASLQQQIASRADVREVNYISKEEALRIFQSIEKGKDIANLISADQNPLPRSLEIKSSQAENLDAIAQFAGQSQFAPLIHSISYQDNKVVIQRLIGMTTFVKKIGWAFSIIFTIISITVILNTIKLTIFMRKDEIEIMRYVGASDNFIKLPFIVEGALYGIIGTIIATILIRIALAFIMPMMNRYLGGALSQTLLSFTSGKFLAIVGLELIIGIVIGIGCSLFGIRKYVKV